MTIGNTIAPPNYNGAPPEPKHKCDEYCDSYCDWCGDSACQFDEKNGFKEINKLYLCRECGKDHANGKTQERSE